jgi:hypothetical protein
VRALTALDLVIAGSEDPWMARYNINDLRSALTIARVDHEHTNTYRDLVERLIEQELYEFREFLPDEGAT